MPEHEEKYFFVKTVRTDSDVSSQILAFDSAKEAEIKYHEEVAYGLQLDTIVLAHYMVMNEYGGIYDNLEKIIDNIPPVEETEEVEE